MTEAERNVIEAAKRPNLSLDGYCDSTGKRWSAVIREHPPNGGPGKIVWERHGMRSEWHSEQAAEAAWSRLMTAGPTINTLVQEEANG